MEMLASNEMKLCCHYLHKLVYYIIDLREYGISRTWWSLPRRDLVIVLKDVSYITTPARKMETIVLVATVLFITAYHPQRLMAQPGFEDEGGIFL